ncbi:caspase family protein [Streptomyces sp. 8ZJF_21]|uniref:VMAP-C domain-containing protein n=1 Tax=Streptomyces sp. 8ZJF_21 TaxID=2903141 RepID=UPI001E5B77DE|nr:caspase family protein [Streptomyces sp. 8ZJF_21]MCD9593360.1 caspase family protein [Streptomyces sp. 8ZJF_21]
MTAIEHDWRRTHAVLVAVERYNGSDRLNLDGPVRDAIGMREWLTGRGVPPENIRLLASPMERNRAALEAAHPGYRPAERADVRKVFREGLSHIDGDDWLWVYWAGHGVQTRGGRWSLLYPETSDTDLQGLDADSLVDLVRTDHLRWDAVERVTVVIDACRQALPPGTHELADIPQPLTDWPQTKPERPVYWMRACQAGAVAMERDGTGRFTSVLLRQLEAQGEAGAALDLDRVWQGVRDEFARLNGAGSGRQYPSVHIIDWDEQGRMVRLGPPAPPLDPEKRRFREVLVLEASGLLGADAAGSAARVAARLCEQFATAPPTTPPSAEELVDWALENPHGTVTLLAELSAPAPPRTEIRKACHLLQNQWLTHAEYTELVALLGRLDQRARYDFAEVAREKYPTMALSSLDPAALVDDLEAVLLPPPRQLPQLLRVVEHFAALCGGAVAGELRAWSLECARRIDLEGQLYERRGEAQEHAERVKADPDTAMDQGAPPGDSRGRIQIRLHAPGADGQRRTYEVWSRRGDDVNSLAKADTPASLEEIQRGLDHLLSRHARTLDTLVEFFVTPTDLELAVHRWQLDADGPLERSLGTDYPVVVRCAELREHQPHLWERRWEKAGTADAGELHWLPAHYDTFKQVNGDLQGQEDAPGVVLTSPVRARKEVFNACLFGGVPVLIWHGEAEGDAAQAELKTLLRTERLRSLPQHLRRLRSASEADESHHGRHMALLWDDPHSPLPDQLDLSAP